MKTDFIKNWDTQLKKGMLPVFVLLTLKKKEYYGYELIEELKSSAGLEVTESTIYPLLTRLMNEGLLIHKWVEQPSGIPRKYYSLSVEGNKKLQEMKFIIKTTISKIEL